MGRTPSLTSSKRLLFENNSSKAITNMPSELNYQASAAKGIIRTENTSEPRKKRKERGYKSSRVLYDDNSSMLADDMQKKTSVSRKYFRQRQVDVQTFRECIRAQKEKKKER
ncbi:uncharacterized protein [Primulina eburnea]|uniref:uncharacterized protein isoform X5 n=1 Tax=Primulina eburnea TaxID=1245227 RepID=UPI003C6C0470